MHSRIDDDSLPLTQREQIDSVCDRFEAAWRDGRPPRAEDYLDEVTAEARPRLLAELLRMELEYRRGAGESPTAAPYRTRFPDHTAVIDSLFGRQDDTVIDRPGVAAEITPTVPGFELLEIIGRGGMGVVYKAWQQRPRRLVALKMILSGEYATPAERSRFVAEAEAAARVRHPNVVQIHQVGEHGGRPYLVLEYVEGGTLAGLLAEGPLPAFEAARCLRTLAGAVHAAHSQGVVHRDLKPGNVLLGVGQAASLSVGGGAKDKQGCLSYELKVTDFGLARRLDEAGSDTRTGQVVGSPPYMAPEQAAGEGKAAGPAADVYSLGVMLYEMLTGSPPFRGATVVETLDQVRHAEPVPPRRLRPTVPRDLETICLKCLEKDPARRYASAGLLADRLGLFLDGRPIPDRPYGRLERAWRWGKRHPVEAALLAVSCLAVLLVGAWWWREAAQAKGQARRRAYEETRDTARALARRGDWSRGLEYFDKALPDAGDDRPAVEVERLRLLFQLGRRHEAAAGAAALRTATPGLELLRAEMALGEGRGTEAWAMLDGALRDGGLDEADAAYARALVATTPALAAAQLERALELNPDHHRASAVLAQVYVLTAQQDRAELQVFSHRRKFVEDPAGPLFDAWLRARAGRHDEARRLLVQLRPRLGAVQADDAERLLRLEADLQREYEELSTEGRHKVVLFVLSRLAGQVGPAQRLLLGLGRGELWGEYLRVLLFRHARWADRSLVAWRSSWQQPRQDWGWDEPTMGPILTRLPWMEDRLAAVRRATSAIFARRLDQAEQHLETAIAALPEATLLYARSALKTMQAYPILFKVRRYTPEVLDLFSASAADAERAADAPSERLLIRRAATRDLLFLDTVGYNFCPGALPEGLEARIERTLTRLLFQLPLTVDEHRRLTRRIATDCHQVRPEWVCPLLRDWRKKSPDDPDVLPLLAEWELRGRNYAAALDLVAEGLKTRKEDRRLLSLQEQAREGLRKLLN